MLKGINLTVMYPLKGKVGRIESPLAIELHSLSVGEFVCKTRASRSRRKKRCRLKSHHRTREETQCASVHLKPLENIWGVEEAYHRNPTGQRETLCSF